jgi:hypothetical protein
MTASSTKPRGDHEDCAGADDHTREHVLAELVRSEQMLAGGRLELAEDVGCYGIVGRNQVAEDRANDPDAREDAAQQERRRADEEMQALVALHLGLVRANRDCNRGGLFVDRRHSAVA